MAGVTDSFDLGRLGLSSGEGRKIELSVRLDPLQYGGERYVPGAGPHPVQLDISRTTSGYALRLRYEARLAGPCMRCLDEADHSATVDAREVDQPGGGEEMSSPYLDADELDLHGWARDALALALPTQILCRDDCLGLCPVCGANLNDAGPDHAHEPEPDPRWAKLGELRFE